AGPLSFHAVEACKMKETTTCQYAQDHGIDCKYRTITNVRHFHCIVAGCGYNTDSTTKVRQHAASHQKKRDKRTLLELFLDTLPMSAPFQERLQSKWVVKVGSSG
ncbi:MAG: hypothetical protein ACK56I_36030, partial [bacterium]